MCVYFKGNEVDFLLLTKYATNISWCLAKFTKACLCCSSLDCVQRHLWYLLKYFNESDTHEWCWNDSLGNWSLLSNYRTRTVWIKILPGSAMLSSQCVSNLTWKNYFWWEQHFSLDAWPFLPTSDTVASKCMDYIGDFILQTEAGQDIFNRIIPYLKKNCCIWIRVFWESVKTATFSKGRCWKKTLFYIFHEFFRIT